MRNTRKYYSELEEAILRQINYCKKHQGFNVGIFVSDKSKIWYVYGCICCLCGKNILKMKRTTGNIHFIFKNKSSIRILIPSDYVRGRKWHGAIIDSDIDKCMVDFNIRSNVIPYIPQIPKWFPKRLRYYFLFKSQRDNECDKRIEYIRI